jgi:SulP family sulfate permease
MQNMIKFSGVSSLTREMEDSESENYHELSENFAIPKNVEVFEINGPLFFGAAYKFREAMRIVEKPPKVLIVRMRKVPIIDATGIKTIRDVHKESTQKGTKLILSEVSGQIREELKEARLMFAIGKANITDTFRDALERSNVILSDTGRGLEKKQAHHRFK